MTGTVHDPCTPDKAVPSGRTPDDQVARRSRGAVLLAVPQAGSTISASTAGGPIRATASTRRRGSRASACTGKARSCSVRTSGRSRCIATATPGMQRYGAFLWSGDVYSTWETLKTHVPVAVNTGLSGIPFWGTDIGGFVPTAEYTGELHVRWFQFGAFCPLFRAHGRTWHLRLPWGWNTGELGPSELRGYTGGAADPDPSELHNAQVEPIVKKYLELRYRLLPYIYTRRARVLRHRPADDARAVAALSGRSAGGRARRSVSVGPRHPRRAGRREGRDVAAALSAAGAWFDFWTEERVEGGREIDRAVDLGDDAAVRARRRDHPAGPGQAVRRRAGRRAADASSSIRAPTARSCCTKTTAGRSRIARARSCGSRWRGTTGHAGCRCGWRRGRACWRQWPVRCACAWRDRRKKRASRSTAGRWR